MTNVLLTTIAAIVVFGLVVLVHEAGLLARRPAWWGWWVGTEFSDRVRSRAVVAGEKRYPVQHPSVAFGRSFRVRTDKKNLTPWVLFAFNQLRVYSIGTTLKKCCP